MQRFAKKCTRFIVLLLLLSLIGGLLLPAAAAQAPVLRGIAAKDNFGIDQDGNTFYFAPGEYFTLVLYIQPASFDPSLLKAKLANQTGDMKLDANFPDYSDPHFLELAITASGTADVVLSTRDGQHVGTFQVVVGDAAPAAPALTGIKIVPDTLTLKVGESQWLEFAHTPSDAEAPVVTVKDYDASVIAVESGARVVALKPGSTVIQAATADGSFAAEARVTVVAADEAPPAPAPAPSPAPVPASPSAPASETPPAPEAPDASPEQPLQEELDAQWREQFMNRDFSAQQLLRETGREKGLDPYGTVMDTAPSEETGLDPYGTVMEATPSGGASMKWILLQPRYIEGYDAEAAAREEKERGFYQRVLGLVNTPIAASIDAYNDTLKNVQLGDPVLKAIWKSLVGNTGAALTGTAVGGADLLLYLLGLNTEYSPVDSIKGGTNLTYDKMTGIDPEAAKQREKEGHYGRFQYTPPPEETAGGRTLLPADSQTTKVGTSRDLSSGGQAYY